MAQEKLYLLDTNVLIEDGHAIEAFPDGRVGIPVMVLEELDNIKSEASFRGRHARYVIRVLDSLRERGSLSQGVKLDNGGMLQIIIPDDVTLMLGKYTSQQVDDQIIKLAQALKARGYDVTLVSKDINMRVKADAFSLIAIDYRAEVVDERSIYKGWTTVEVPSIQLKKDIPDDLYAINKEHPFVVNEFIIAQSSGNQYNSRLFRYTGDNNFIAVGQPDLKWSLQPKNIQQRMAFDLLFDDNIKLVTLIGGAGTGKTFLALLAGLHEVLIYENYEKMLITRPVIPLGPDIGFLPGDVREKLHIWMQPIYDNMDFIVHAAQNWQRAMGIHHDEDLSQGYSGGGNGNGHGGQGHAKNKKRKVMRDRGIPTLDQLVERGKISLEAITYMRGRSIPYQFVIIDEVQNLTTHEVKTLISRVGEGSKVILTGDPYQIDAHHLDFSNNGLVVASERFKGQSIFGTVFLESTERSELSRLAAKLL